MIIGEVLCTCCTNFAISRQQRLVYNHHEQTYNMILPGCIALQRTVITNLRSAKHQVQPCGIDLTLKRVLKWTSSGTIDFDNTQRQTSQTVEIPFEPSSTTIADKSAQQHNHPDTNIPSNTDLLHLSPGSYLIEFNERVAMPLDLMGQILVRSSLFRSGALIHAGVMDSGYEGPVGAMLQVVNPSGLRVMRDAKMAQMVVHGMSESVGEGYRGVYAGREFV